MSRDFIIGGCDASRFFPKDCARHGRFYANTCPQCNVERLAERLFGSDKRPSDEVLFDREWAL